MAGGGMAGAVGLAAGSSTPASGLVAARSHTAMVVPRPSATGECASTEAPMAEASSDTMARPRPEPFRRPLTRSEMKWRSNTLAR